MINQLEMISVESLVPPKHPYRTFKRLLDFNELTKSITYDEKNSPAGAEGYGKERLILCLILQFIEDLSDREMERFIGENIAAKWFAGFGMSEATPTYSTFCKFRKLVGTKNMSNLFEAVNAQLKEKGMMREIFTFVDSTALISKLTTWEERDKAIADGEKTFNNEVAKKKKYQVDKQARFGSKGKTKFWFGFKKTVAVDTQSSLIQKVAVTPADATDADAAKHVLPAQGAVMGDKGFVPIVDYIRKHGLHPMILLRNNMSAKIAELDKWISKLRSPFERTFSKQNKRVRYRGVAKNQGAEFMYAIAYNMRRMLVLENSAV